MEAEKLPIQSEMHNSIPILCTRPVSRQLINEALEKNISLEILSFIETSPVENVEVQQEIENAVILTTTVVFTSMNAVEAVSLYVEEPPSWKIYCIGNTTKQLVIKYFGEALLAGTAASASELAAQIVEDGEADEVIFFCGDQRRDDLPSILISNDIDVNEIVVYETIQVPHKISQEYFGILFFSPSAVESFFLKNKLPEQTILFAIGNTTAETIKRYSKNKIIIADEPDKESLVYKMIEYFS